MNKIIEAARAAGMTASIGQTTNGKYKPNVNALGRSVPVEWLERFYAIAHQQGMEHLASEAIDTVARHGGSVEIEAAIRALPSQQDHFADVNKMVDRHTLQAQGKHPAPCARFCEANAFRAEARELTRLAQPITSLTTTERARLLTAADHLEGDGHFMDCADAEWAAQWLRRLLPNTP